MVSRSAGSSAPVTGCNRTLAWVKIRTVSILAMVLGLSLVCGCENIKDSIRGSTEGIVGARPIKQDLYSSDTMKKVIDDKTEAARNLMVANMMLDSAEKCSKFLNSVGITGRTTDTLFDVTTTALAALGAAFTPANTVRALAAGAAISSGSKTAIDANVFGQKTSPILFGQITNNYETGLKSFTGNWSRTITDWPPPLAASQMIIVHNKCSLDAALSSLNQELGKSAALQAMLDKDPGGVLRDSKPKPAQ